MLGVYKIRNQKIFYLLLKRKSQKKKKHAKTVKLENKLKDQQQNPYYIFNRNYLDYKKKLEQIYEEKANGVKIRSVSGTSSEKNLQNFSLT